MPQGATSYSSELAIPTGNYSWVAVRAFAQNDETIRLAHSQPAWLNGEWDAREDAQYFITWIDDLIEVSESEPDRFANEQDEDHRIRCLSSRSCLLPKQALVRNNEVGSDIRSDSHCQPTHPAVAWSPALDTEITLCPFRVEIG